MLSDFEKSSKLTWEKSKNQLQILEKNIYYVQKQICCKNDALLLSLGRMKNEDRTL